MKTHELINHIQGRLRRSVVFKDIFSAVEFVVFEWGCHVFCCFPSAVNKNRLLVFERCPKGSEVTLHSRYLEGVLNGGVRDDAGTLVMPTEKAEVDNG